MHMKNYIIGAIHFPPMPGYLNYPGFDVAFSNALFDMKAFEDSGVDALIIENNYDIPHVENISSEAREQMIKLGIALKEKTKLPIGVSVLWNDYKSALLIAKAINGEFIRVPVFVDCVKTSYGIMREKAEEVVELRKKEGLENIKIFADIHVKHAEILSNYSIGESARIAIQKGADALIITGKWTGNAPQMDDLRTVREVVGDFPIICGSGVDSDNIKDLFGYANGAIVSTSLKEGGGEDLVNVKSYDSRISKAKVRELITKVK